MAMQPSKYTLEQEKKAIRKCNRCGCDIEWVTNRNGKEYFADVVWNRDNYGNLRPYTDATMFHRCRGNVAEQIAQAEKNIAQCDAELADAIANPSWFDTKPEIIAQRALWVATLEELKAVA